MAHPLLKMFIDAADGRFPAPDGGVTFTGPLPGGMQAVVGFTGHAVFATPLGAADFDDLQLDGFGASLHPEVLLRLAGGGTIYGNDVTLVARGTGLDPAAQPVLTASDRWEEHPRVQFARSQRSNVQVYGDETGFVTLSSGLAERREMGVEINPEFHGSGTGRRFLDGARQLVGVDEWLFAAVAPGNARSLRSFLSQGFVPIATEILIGRPSTPEAS